MSYVIYDVETTGLRKGFDQIVEVAAVRANADLDVVDRLQLSCRLQPHIIPSFGALQTTGTDIATLLRDDLQSHYQMVCGLHAKISSWAPSLFIGFNSMYFDEEMLRHAFYQCLLPMFVTNTQGSARADFLGLARVAASLRPNVLTPAYNTAGKPIFRLAELAAANGIAVVRPHEAMADVEATLALCRIVKDGASDLWSRFAQFSQKARVLGCLRDERVFLLFQGFNDGHRLRVLTRIGQHQEQPNRQYCIDLQSDLALLKSMSNDELVSAFSDRAGPLVVIKANTAPMLCPFYLADDNLNCPTESEALALADDLHGVSGLIARLEAAARAAERTYAPAVHLEQKLYGTGWPSPCDSDLLTRFHAVSWEERVALADQFEDGRFRSLARRLIFFERPDVLPIETSTAFAAGIRARLQSTVPVPWLTLAEADAELRSATVENALTHTANLAGSYGAYLRSFA